MRTSNKTLQCAMSKYLYPSHFSCFELWQAPTGMKGLIKSSALEAIDRAKNIVAHASRHVREGQSRIWVSIVISGCLLSPARHSLQVGLCSA